MKIVNIFMYLLIINFSFLKCSNRIDKSYISGTSAKYSDQFEIVFLDTLIFSEHNIFIIKSSKNYEYFIISKKYKYGQSMPGFKKYVVIGLGKTYKLTINKLDTIPKFHIRGELNPINFSIWNEKIISNDKVMIDIYSSKNIFTKF